MAKRLKLKRSTTVSRMTGEIGVQDMAISDNKHEKLHRKVLI